MTAFNYFILALFSFPFFINAEITTLIAAFHTFENYSSNQVKAFENEIKTYNTSVTFAIINDTCKDEEMLLKCRMSYLPVGILVNWEDVVLSSNMTINSTIEFNVTIHAKRLGGSNLTCSIISRNSSKLFYDQVIFQLIVSRHVTPQEVVFRVVISLFIIFLTFVMGCGLDLQIIYGYFKTPISPFIGFCSQFIFMPLISGGLAKLTNIDNAFGLGLLVIGCSPGGGASNIWTILFGGDLNLSMTMTFISSCAALFMMPLWLFLLGRFFIDPKDVRIPYDNIALNLLQVVVPAALGIIFRLKWDDAAKLLMRKVKLMGLVFIIFIFTYGTYANWYIYKLMGDYLYLLPIGAMLPWLGFLFGFLVATITRRGKSQAIAIALETGFQNIGIAILILKFSMPQPYGDLGSAMPIIVALFTPLPLYFGFAALTIKRKFCSPPEIKKNVEMNIQSDEQKNVLLKDDKL